MLRKVIALALVGALGVGAATAEPDPPVPRGSRLRDDRHVSALGFRATADWYAKQWRRRGVAVQTIGPYRVAGVDVIRFVREDLATAPWRAVHVYRLAGTTWISVVPNPALDAVPTSAAPSPSPAPLDADGSTR